MIVKQRIQKPDGSIRYRNYLKQSKLGKGGFAECFTVQRMEDKKHFALKIINKKMLQKPKAKQKMLSQISLHKSVKHRSICHLQRAFEDQENVYILLELCNNGNMFDLIKKRKKLTIPETQYFIHQLIDGLCYLHNKQIVHRDIKLGNILINQKMELKLADFGLATKLQFLGDRKHTVCGTPNYIAPEVILSSMGLGISGHSYEVDVWSTGVIMYLMLFGKAPFQTHRVQKTYQKISRGDFSFPDHFKDSSAKDLLRKIMVVDVSKRFTFEQILAHEFMNPKNGIPKEIPVTCMTNVPKFDNKYQKLQSSEVKESARNFSINTLRSQIQFSVDQHCFQGLPGFSKKEQKSKDIKGLLKTVFSTSSLSRSLQKLGNISRNISPMAKNAQTFGMNRTSQSKEKPGTTISSIRDRQKLIKENPPKFATHVYILEYKKEVIISYILNTGYIGTYDPHYKLLFNKKEDLYFQALEDSPLKRLKPDGILNNQNIENRKKFIRNFLEHPIECQTFLNTARVVYLIRTFEVKTENVIIFKFSNNTFQVKPMNHNKMTLLITKDEMLVLIRFDKGREVDRILCSKQETINCKDNDLIHLYLTFQKLKTHKNKDKK